MAKSNQITDVNPSRRKVLIGGAGMAAAAGLSTAALATETKPAIGSPSHGNHQGKQGVNTIATKDGTQIYFKYWGKGRPVVFSHGWPLDADAWDAQMVFLGGKGYRVIAHDRRVHGRSGQPWDGNDMDTCADDLAALIGTLDLKGATLVGHSTGGATFMYRHGTPFRGMCLVHGKHLGRARRCPTACGWRCGNGRKTWQA